MRAAVRALLALTALLLLTATAAAQNSEELSKAADELRRASALLEPAHQFFRQEAFDKQRTPKEEERIDSFRRFKQAAEIFQRSAPKQIIGDVLRIAQSMFAGRQLPTPPTLIEAVEECEERRDAQLTQLVSSTLGSFLTGAREDIEAEIAFGPIIDNPQLYGEITPPTNAIEFLRNLRFALDHDVVLRRDFYTQENLKRFFGAQATIYKKPNGRIYAGWAVRPTASALARLKPVVARYAQCQYSVGLRLADSGKKNGWIGVGCNYEHAGSPTLEDVEQVFGKEWRDTWIPPPHGLPPSPTSPDGNKRMTYNVDKGSLRRSIDVSFGPDGTFNSFHLAEEEH